MSPTQSARIHLLPDASAELARWARSQMSAAASPFDAARAVSRRLGAHCRESTAEIGFWLPKSEARQRSDGDVLLEVFTPLTRVDLRSPVARVPFRRDRVPLLTEGDFAWGVVAGMKAGRRDDLGALYQALYRDESGEWRLHLDPLAYSLPFGAFAPAEFYDVQHMLDQRRDRAHFDQLRLRPDADGVGRVQAPTNILQIHVNTASQSGTFEGLCAVYRGITQKLRQGQPLTPGEQNFAGYDAVQLMPIEPIIEYERGPRFWEVQEESEDEVVVRLRRPDMTNWGYDVVIAGSPAVNPATLASGRPDEFLAFVEALHNFPEKPIQVILDVVYGHADNQALQILDPHYFAGSNMYGQNLNYGHPMVRAVLLEMQRRKGNYGIDGVRVDGAQDFKVWDAEAGVMRHDDDFLRQMNDLQLDVAGRHYRPWMIFEDGRPWPDADWELSSSYREVTKQMPSVVQWGPLTFAHNTPFLVTFWISKWWRIRQIAEIGRDWITGCANHDTLRRGTQAPFDARVNFRLGDSLPEILRQAYDNPAARLFDYALMPGVPMEFVNANMRAPWSFIRNTDQRYAVKVAVEEARFLWWAVGEADFEQAERFGRLKKLGFERLSALKRFVSTLAHFVQVTGNDLEEVARLLSAQASPPPAPLLAPAGLQAFGRAWMDDVHDFCNVTVHAGRLDAAQTAYDLRLREFRRERPWLMENMTSADHFDYLRPLEGAVVFYGLRHGPDGSESLLFVANMEGRSRAVSPLSLPIPRLAREGWQVALRTPGLQVTSAAGKLALADSQGVVFSRRPG